MILGGQYDEGFRRKWFDRMNQAIDVREKAIETETNPKKLGQLKHSVARIRS